MIEERLWPLGGIRVRLELAAEHLAVVSRIQALAPQDVFLSGS